MTTSTSVTYAQQLYNLDVSFFTALRGRIVSDFSYGRTEYVINALSALDGSLWLDRLSFEHAPCRIKDCAETSAKIAARFVAEKSQRQSRVAPEDNDPSCCECCLVPGTLIVLPRLADFRNTDIELEAKEACGPMSFASLEGGFVFGVKMFPLERSAQYKLRGFNRLKMFVMVCYMDIKSGKCHFSLASPIVRPKVPWSCLGRLDFNASGEVRKDEEETNEISTIESATIEAIIDHLINFPLKSGFFVVCNTAAPDRVVADILDITYVDKGQVLIRGKRYHSNQIMIGGIGPITLTGALPRHWSTVILVVCHVLHSYGSTLDLMIIDPIALQDRGMVKGTAVQGTLAAVYTLRCGLPPLSAGDVILSCCYKPNLEYREMKTLKHEHILDFSYEIDPTFKDRVDAQLHLQTMKGRVIPDLNPNAITALRVCVIGAGAIGCHVIRQLLAWGVSNIVVIDHGKVHNATRQCLYRTEDAKQNTHKAVIACQEIQRINSSAQATPVVMSVPMPGHHIKDEELETNYHRLRNLMLGSDVTFLATDTRESRWLPSLIALAQDRSINTENETILFEDDISLQSSLEDIENSATRVRNSPLVICAGATFDSWMVIRHAYGKFRGGCYFCSDVQTPSDSVTGRPMEETCTLVKPGVIATCAAAATELLISLTQHPEGFEAQHGSSSCLGEVPHAMSMSLSGLSVEKITMEASERCICCSEGVIKAFNKNPVNFLKRAFSKTSFISNISGLDQMLESVQAYDATKPRVESDFVVL